MEVRHALQKLVAQRVRTRGRAALGAAGAFAGLGAALLGNLLQEDGAFAAGAALLGNLLIGEKGQPIQTPAGSHLPKEVNWVTRGAVTPPLHQMQCGSCWAFTGIAAVEGAHKIGTGVLETLSPQCVIDCAVRTVGDKMVKGKGCKGGAEYDVYHYAMHHGLNRLSDYPLLPFRHHSICLAAGKPVVCKISGWTSVDITSEDVLMEHVARQPIPIGVDRFPGESTFKGGHVIEIEEWPPAKAEKDRETHTVLVVAYGEGGKYPGKWWLVKNSRGPSWGDGGFAYLRRGVPNSEGVGGMYRGYSAFYPHIPTSEAKSDLQEDKTLEAKRMEEVTERIQQKLQEANAAMQQRLTRAGILDHVNFTIQLAYFKCAHDCIDRRRTMEENKSCVDECYGPVSTASTIVGTEMSKFEERLHESLVLCQDEFEAAKLHKNADAFRGLESCVNKSFHDSIRTLPNVVERIKSNLKIN